MTGLDMFRSFVMHVEIRVVYWDSHNVDEVVTFLKAADVNFKEYEVGNNHSFYIRFSDSKKPIRLSFYEYLCINEKTKELFKLSSEELLEKYMETIPYQIG
jgi:hypothetical protein